MLRRSCKTSRTATTPSMPPRRPSATALQRVHSSAAAHAAGNRPGGPPVCSGLPYGTEARALVIWMPERRCCCALAAQAFCARSSRWSRCSCSRPWPSVHFSCAPLLNTHARAHTHARIHTHAPPGNAPHRAGRRRTRTGPGHTRRSWAHAPRSRTRLSTHTRTRHQTAPLEALYNPLQVLRPGARGRNPHALAAAAVLLHLDRLPVRLPHEQGLAPDQPLLPRRLHGASPRQLPPIASSLKPPPPTVAAATAAAVAQAAAPDRPATSTYTATDTATATDTDTATDTITSHFLFATSTSHLHLPWRSCLDSTRRCRRTPPPQPRPNPPPTHTQPHTQPHTGSCRSRQASAPSAPSTRPAASASSCCRHNVHVACTACAHGRPAR